MLAKDGDVIASRDDSKKEDDMTYDRDAVLTKCCSQNGAGEMDVGVSRSAPKSRGAGAHHACAAFPPRLGVEAPAAFKSLPGIPSAPGRAPGSLPAAPG